MYRNLMLLTWSGPLSIGLVLLGWMVLAGFLPPPSPSMTAEQTQALWLDNREAKILGMLFSAWGGTIYVIFAILVYSVMSRIERGRVMSVGQVAMAMFAIAFFCWNFFWLASVGFQADEASADTIDAMSDTGFLMTFAPIPPFTLQYVFIAWVILQDRSNDPYIPRWVGFANLWCAFFFMPAQFAVLAKTGPFAWNGLLSFWIAVGEFVVWFAVMFWANRRALRMMAADGLLDEPERAGR
ncbi:hypothetical protein CIW51_03610 [Mycolicibacterium sp. P9-22]|nr:hypothetical protein CIW51_03610 [Mycolicibacterium sp. P9-22]